MNPKNIGDCFFQAIEDETIEEQVDSHMLDIGGEAGE